jgi:hypothetical protein
MLSKNLVLRKRCYYYGDTKIKTDSKIYLSKTKMELMKKNFFKVLDYVKSIFEEDIATIDLEAKERIVFGEQALVFRNSKNEDYIVFYVRAIGGFGMCKEGKILKNGYEFSIMNDDTFNDMDEEFLYEIADLFSEVQEVFETNKMLEIT